MRNKRRFIKFTLVVAVVAVMLAIGFHGTKNKTGTEDRDSSISLQAPSFISVAEAAGFGESAFPAGKAGMSAYVKVDTPIDIDKVRSIFSEVLDVGENYIVGIVKISNADWDATVNVYVDVDGWLVAYVSREWPASRIFKHPSVASIESTTITEALGSAGSSAGVAVLPEIKYYDFRFPDAEAITVFVKTGEMVQVKIPTDWKLYEASFYTAYNVSVDGKSIRKSRDGFGSYGGAIAVGTLHTIELPEPGRVTNTTATMLIWRYATDISANPPDLKKYQSPDR